MSVSDQNKRIIMPLLALRGLVVFPGMTLHFDVGRDRSIAALNYAMTAGQRIFLTLQSDLKEDDPKEKDLYKIGCIAKIKQVLRVSDDLLRVVVEGQDRAMLDRVIKEDPFFVSEIHTLSEKPVRAGAVLKEALIRRVRDLFGSYATVSPKMPPNVMMSVLSEDDIGYLSDFIAANIPIEADDKQYCLEEIDPIKRIKLVSKILNHECEILNMDAKIAEKVKFNMDENQRDYYLREQIKVISEELYGEDSPEAEAEEYFAKIRSLNANSEVRDKLIKETQKLSKMPAGSHEATVVRNYLDTCIELPWGVFGDVKINLDRAEKQLNHDHFGLNTVKERIIESLAVQKLTGKVSGNIICLVGPPGVGKTSIASSVAKACGRRFARVSLGGVHDEAEIRGHRRTYIGAMPGSIIDAVKRAGTANPLILFDEIDKLASDYKGDPASALLEALDPEQNSTFKDHFIDLPFDLSSVMFITTANSLDTIPAALKDRMEIIEIPGYTRNEKLMIAKKYLVKKQLTKHGLTAKNLKLNDRILMCIIERYTREAGVRRLEQLIAKICRKTAKLIVSGDNNTVTLSEKNIRDFLGVERYKPDSLAERDEVGVVNGLAWTAVGGEIMQLEVSVVDGTGKLELTGSLGDVMKESAKTALTYVRSIADILGLPKDFYKNKDFHIHATEAAVPKDGPSAGVTIATALVSALTGIPVRKDIAMTGEITLRGKVLAIGGLKEKTMAAYTNNINTVFIPYDNKPDLQEIDPKVKEALQFSVNKNAWDVISGALVKPVELKRADDTKSIIFEQPVHNNNAFSKQ